MPLTLPRPLKTDHHAYYSVYIDQVPEGDVLEILEREHRSTQDLLRGIDDPAWWSYRYAPEKWTLNEVVGHMVDAERLFGFRAFWISRADPSELPSMDQDAFARESRANERSLASLLQEFEALRRSHLLLLESMDDETLARRSVASGWEIAVRAIPYILAGHEIHHRKVLEERYLKPLREKA